jgi:hypothetical protein
MIWLILLITAWSCASIKLFVSFMYDNWDSIWSVIGALILSVILPPVILGGLILLSICWLLSPSNF